MTRVFISIGSNIDPERYVPEAVRRLAREMRITGVSTFYRSPAVGRPEQPPFYNGVVEGETALPPAALKFDVLRRIEMELGRVREPDRYAPRTIDLDILLYGDRVLREDGLAIPDPQIAERAFLALPLCELAPELTLPGSGEAIRDIAHRLAGEPLQVLRELTARLRREVTDGSQQGAAPDP